MDRVSSRSLLLAWHAGGLALLRDGGLGGEGGPGDAAALAGLAGLTDLSSPAVLLFGA